MILKSQAIVLHSYKFGESSLILKVYTENSGLISCIIHGVRKSKSQNKSAVFQLLNRLELVYYQKIKDQMGVIKEVKILKPFQSLHSDMRKTTIGLFLAEVLLKSFREEQPNPVFFNYLMQQLEYLDKSENNFSNLHLEILMKIALEQGIKPMNNFSDENKLFDLQNGIFVNTNPDHPFFLKPEISILFNYLLLKTEGKTEALKLKREDRLNLLKGILQYLKIHLGGFGDVKSLEILEEILQ